MKDLPNKRKNAGFTLLELVVVVGIMGLMSTMAMDLYTDKSNQKRFELTKQRLAEIKFAIIGDPMMKVDNQKVLSGFYYDMGQLPTNLKELISDQKSKGSCTTNTGATTFTSEANCTPPSSWETLWNGPYITNIQSSSGNLVFADAWGNGDITDNFGWVFEPSTTPAGSLKIQSLGLDRDTGSLGDNRYEDDYPASILFLVTKAETDIIDELKKLKHTGYCYDIVAKSVNSLIKDKLLCTKTWLDNPTQTGHCINTDSNVINASYIDSPSCILVTNHIWAPIT